MADSVFQFRHYKLKFFLQNYYSLVIYFSDFAASHHEIIPTVAHCLVVNSTPEASNIKVYKQTVQAQVRCYRSAEEKVGLPLAESGFLTQQELLSVLLTHIGLSLSLILLNSWTSPFFILGMSALFTMQTQLRPPNTHTHSHTLPPPTPRTYNFGLTYFAASDFMSYQPIANSQKKKTA